MKAKLPAAKVTVSRRELEKAVDLEVQKRYQEIVTSACINTMSLVLFTLDKQYGFRRRRLWRFLHEMTASDALLSAAPLGRQTNSNDILGYLDRKYCIDLTKELTREV